jgi:Holliday junction resolvase RusA-like endonuclease
MAERNIIETDWYTVNLKVNTNHRPRLKGKTAFLDPMYKSFVDTLKILFKGKKIKIDDNVLQFNIPKADYFEIEIIAYYNPLKKDLKNPMLDIAAGDLYRSKPDWDNIAKPILDALDKAGVFKDDSQLSDGIVRKRIDLESEYFMFRLKGYV